MPSSDSEAIGGPLDGSTFRGSLPFVWLSAIGVRHRVTRAKAFEDRGPSRYLYRRIGVVAGKPLFLYAGYTHAPCGNCGGWNELSSEDAASSCQLCGGELSPSSDRP